MLNSHVPRVPLTLSGNELYLACNLNVIAEIQERYKGDFSAVGAKIAAAKELIFLVTLMVNEDRKVQARAQSLPSPDDITEEEIGSCILGDDLQRTREAVMEAIKKAFPPNPKNAQTTRKKAST